MLQHFFFSLKEIEQDRKFYTKDAFVCFNREKSLIGCFNRKKIN